MFDVRFWGPAVAAQKVKFRPGGSMTLTIGMLTFRIQSGPKFLIAFQGQVVVRPPPTFSVLSGISGAVDSMARGLAIDLAPVRVNVVSVGLVETEVITLASVFYRVSRRC